MVMVIIHVVGRIQKDVFVVYVKILSHQLSGSTRDSYDKLVCVGCLQIQIRTKYHLNLK
jgi:hypothetical protein